MLPERVIVFFPEKEAPDNHKDKASLLLRQLRNTGRGHKLLWI